MRKRVAGRGRYGVHGDSRVIEPPSPPGSAAPATRSDDASGLDPGGVGRMPGDARTGNRARRSHSLRCWRTVHSEKTKKAGPGYKPVQCSTGPFWAFALEQSMDALAEAGFTEIELMVTRDPRTQSPEIPLRLAEERGLKIASVHGPFLVVTKNVWGVDPIQKIKRGAEMCRAVGASVMIVHPPYLYERSFARWITKQSEAFKEETGVTVAVETMYPLWVAGRRMRAYRWLEPRDLVAACPWVAMDTSHLTVARRDILESFETLAPRLVHIHLSNNAGDGRDGHLELEKGILPLDRLLSEVKGSGFSGAVSLELSVGRYIERHADLVTMLRRNREYVEKRLGGEKRVQKGLPRAKAAATKKRTKSSSPATGERVSE